MAKWIIKSFPKTSKWVRRCPYCGHMEMFDEKPGDSFGCSHCKAIVSLELYRKLTKLSRVFSGR